jgi:speckle-type POZ protein
VIIKTKEGKEFFAHQCYLSRSDVFDAMLSANMKEAEEKIIEIIDIEHDVLVKMLRYLYWGEISNIKEMALDLLVAADKYNIQDLVDKCLVYLMSNINLENHGQILIIADKLNLKCLKEAAIDFIIDNRKEIFDSEGWKEFKINNMPLALEIVEKNMSSF